jgi:hypothetical protein
MYCNDELRGGPELIRFCRKELASASSNTAYLVKQVWWYGKTSNHFTLRLIKPHHGWYYKGAIHEYLTSSKATFQDEPHVPHEVILYQDRTLDDDKTGKRFHRDKVLLLEEYASTAKTERTVYYLAQTFECLGEHDSAYKYYFERTRMVGYFEEKYNAFMRCGDIAREHLHKPFEEYAGFYLEAYKFWHRVEPLLHLATYYSSQQMWKLAFVFIDLACQCTKPVANLGIDEEAYSYSRWHQMGIIAYYVEEYQKGYLACCRAIDVGGNELDKSNKTFYESKLF